MLSINEELIGDQGHAGLVIFCPVVQVPSILGDHNEPRSN